MTARYIHTLKIVLKYQISKISRHSCVAKKPGRRRRILGKKFRAFDDMSVGRTVVH